MNLDQTEKEKKKLQRKKKIKKIIINILLFILSAAVWCSIVYYGYTYAKNYVDTKIKNVQQQNAVNIQHLNEKINLMNEEIKSLREAIEDADSNLSYSARVQRKIDKKLNELDERLEELKRSLEILKQAPKLEEEQNAEN